MQIEIKKLENSEIEITGAIPTKDLVVHKEKAVKNLSANIKVQGFRKGHVPENILVQKIGEGAILEEMAELALRDEYPKIVIENKIDAIGRPEVSITKIAKDNPLEFKIKVAVMPEVELADYKAIAKKIMAKKESIEVTEKEIEDTIAEIRKMRAQAAAAQKERENEEGNEDEKAEVPAGTEVPLTSGKELPEFNDEFVKTLGDFKDVEDFKEKLKSNLKQEKEKKSGDKKKAETIESIIKNSTISLPNILIESELDKMTAQFKDDVMRAGGTFEEYLKHIKKTGEDIRKEWRTDAEKRAKSQLIVNKIAIEEKIIAPKEEIDKQVKQLLEHYKDADPQRARVYIETVLTNEKVFEFLENQGK
jgi:trigger factor